MNKKKNNKNNPTTNETDNNKNEHEEKPDIVTLSGGVQYQEVFIGNGKPVKTGQSLQVRYKGMLQNAFVFDQNMPRGKPFTFVLGDSNVIQGWNQGIQGMRVGGRRNLLIPASLGYGARGKPPDIPPNSPLIFELEVLSAKKQE